METSYIWSPINVEGWKRFCKEQHLPLRCSYCDGVMIDRVGRLRTKGPMWSYAYKSPLTDTVTPLGKTHESCCYGIEVPTADCRDSNWSKSPPGWT